jgi:hypothetical protein
MINKILALSLLVSSVAVAAAAPPHHENHKARQDQHGRHFSSIPGLHEHIERNGVPTHWPHTSEYSS